LSVSRLEAIREAAQRLADRYRLGRDVFPRGRPEPVTDRVAPRWEATLYDLLSAYARQRQKQFNARVELPQRQVWSLVEAREALERLVGQVSDWIVLDSYLASYISQPAMRATVRASTLSATLEMVREGRLAIRQDRPFAPLWVRTASATPVGAEAGAIRDCAWASSL